MRLSLRASNLKKFIFPSFHFSIERWKWNEQFQVFVSTEGNFRDENKKVIQLKMNSSGYWIVPLKCGNPLAHRIVLNTFQPQENLNGYTVDHKDNNKRNNKLSNLEWVSLEENQRRAIDIQLPQNLIKNSTYIYTEGLRFNSMDNAVDWVLQSTGNYNCIPAYRANVALRIRKAIDNKTTYCGKEWREK